MKQTGLNLVALFDNNPRLVAPFPNVPLYHGKEGFEAWFVQKQSGNPIGFLVAIGGNLGKVRLEIQEYLESFGLVALMAQHPTAFVADDVKIGAGSQILAHATVCVETTVGRGCIINSAASVDHECHISSGVHIAPGAHLAGCVEVGPFAMIGIGATILPRIKIGEGATVGAGAVVTKNVVPYDVVVGNPARSMQTRSSNG